MIEVCLCFALAATILNALSPLLPHILEDELKGFACNVNGMVNNRISRIREIVDFFNACGYGILDGTHGDNQGGHMSDMVACLDNRQVTSIWSF